METVKRGNIYRTEHFYRQQERGVFNYLIITYKAAIHVHTHPCPAIPPIAISYANASKQMEIHYIELLSSKLTCKTWTTVAYVISEKLIFRRIK